MNIKILLSRNCVLSMFHDNLYRRKNKRKTKKKNFICTFLHHMLKYAKFVEYVAIPGTCIYMHQTIFFFLCVFTANQIVHIFHSHGAAHS